MPSVRHKWRCLFPPIYYRPAEALWASGFKAIKEAYRRQPVAKWKTSASARSSSFGFSPSEMPELGTRTDWVRTDKASLERRSFNRSWEERFHKRPAGQTKTYYLQQASIGNCSYLQGKVKDWPASCRLVSTSRLLFSADKMVAVPSLSFTSILFSLLWNTTLRSEPAATRCTSSLSLSRSCRSFPIPRR